MAMIRASLPERKFVDLDNISHAILKSTGRRNKEDEKNEIEFFPVYIF